MEEKDEKGFVFKDRRKISVDELDQEPEPENRETGKQEEKVDARFEETSRDAQEKKRAPLPEVEFSTFVFSLSSSALVHLGEIPDPDSQRSHTDFPMAKQIIDTLGMLQEKTRGNLDPDEERLLKTVLYDLRLRYVQKCSGAC